MIHLILCWILKVFAAINIILTPLAVIAGFLWWWKRRESKPRLILTHSVDMIEISKHKQLIRVSVLVENVGKIRRKIDSMTVCLRSGKPTDTFNEQPSGNYREYPRTEIIEKTNNALDSDVEPNCKQQTVFEFIIDKQDDLIVLSEIENAEKSKNKNTPITWSFTSYEKR